MVSASKTYPAIATGLFLSVRPTSMSTADTTAPSIGNTSDRLRRKRLPSSDARPHAGKIRGGPGRDLGNAPGDRDHRRVQFMEWAAIELDCGASATLGAPAPGLLQITIIPAAGGLPQARGAVRDCAFYTAVSTCDPKEVRPRLTTAVP